jgi:hypothetical protein
MTAAQKAARVKFNKAIAIRKKTGCTLKEAFAQVYGKKVGAVKKKAAKRKPTSTLKKVATKAKKYVKSLKDSFNEGYYGTTKRKPVARKKKVSEKDILNKIHRVKKDVDVLDEAQHKHMMGGKLKLSKGESRLGLVKKEPKKLGLLEQIGKIKMGSTFMYYKGFSIERMLITIKDKKKKLPVFIVHELGNTYKTLAQAKAAINFLGR